MLIDRTNGRVTVGTGHHEAHCVAHGLRISGRAAVEYAKQPGALRKHNFPRELDLGAAAAMGRMPTACRGAMPPTGLGGQKFLANLLDGPGATAEPMSCTLTVHHNVIFLADKYGGGNPWHALEDLLHAFTLVSMAHFDVDKTLVVLVDRPMSGPPVRDYLMMWDFVWDAMSGAGAVTSLGELLLNASQLAAAVGVADVTDPTLAQLLAAPTAVTVDQMQHAWGAAGGGATVCFGKSTFSLHGGVSMLSKTDRQAANCDGSPLVLGLVDLALSRLRGGAAVPLSYADRDRDTRKLSLLLIRRGGSKTNTKGRRLADPNALARQLAAIANVVVDLQDFDSVPWHEQLAAVRRADIFIGVHGAGLTWTAFLPPASALVEILLDSAQPCHCFDSLARWSGHPYRAAHVASSSADYRDVVARVRQMMPGVHTRIEALQGGGRL